MANDHQQLLEPILIHERVTQSTWSTLTCYLRQMLLYLVIAIPTLLLPVLYLSYLGVESIATPGMPQQRSITDLPRRNINRSCFAYDGWSILLQPMQQLQRVIWQRKGTVLWHVWSRDEHSTRYIAHRPGTRHRSHHTYTGQTYSVRNISARLIIRRRCGRRFYFWKQTCRTAAN